MPRIVTRALWGARKPKATPDMVPIGSRTATCVHHDGSEPVILRTFEGACDRIRKDQAFHIDGRGWNDIGYNYLVTSAPGFPDIDGLIFEGRGRDAIGAHCLNHNTEWIGVQVATGGDQHPSPAALLSVRWLHDTFATAAGHALGMVGHSDGFATECPGPELYAWVHKGMPIDGHTTAAASATNPSPALEEDIVKPWFIRAKTGAIVIVGPTGVRPVTPAQWSVWTNLGYTIDTNVAAMDPGPFAAVIASLGGLVK